MTEHPEVFGLHANANISFQQQESSLILSTVLGIQPRESGAAGGRRPEEVVEELASNMLQRVPQKLSRDSAHPSVFAVNPDTGMIGSLGTCLGQEMGRFNKLLGRIRSTLVDLQKAIKGLIVMTADLDAMFTSMHNNAVPELWVQVGYPSLKPLSAWFEDMIQRVTFFRDWVEHGRPVAYLISAFYFPQGFLTSVLQAYSRQYTVPVDVLSFEFILQDFDNPHEEVDSPPDEVGGVYHSVHLVSGLFGLRHVL
jgi:dynein heavy chain